MAYDQIIVKDSTSQMIEVMVRDSTTGAGKTGIAYGSVTHSFWREGAASGTAATCVDMTLGTWTTKGWKEVDATNNPGVYQFGIPNAALATGANAVTISFKASGMIDKTVRVLLVNADLRDSVRLGLTALPNAVPGASGGLPTQNGAKLNQTADLTAGQTITATCADATTLLGKFSGITSMAHWLRGLFNKRAMDATAQTEIRDTTGTFDPTTDSNEAIRDTAPMGTAMRGTDGANTVTPDAAGVVGGLLTALESHGDTTWATATGFATTAEIAAAKTVIDNIATAFVADGAVYQLTANALELAPSGTGTTLDADQLSALTALYAMIENVLGVDRFKATALAMVSGALTAPQAAQLLSIYNKTAAGVTFTTPVDPPTGNFIVWRGYDNTAEHGTELPWSVDTPDLTGATVRLIKETPTPETETAIGTATVSDPGGTAQTVSVDLTAAQKATSITAGDLTVGIANYHLAAFWDDVAPDADDYVILMTIRGEVR